MHGNNCYHWFISQFIMRSSSQCLTKLQTHTEQYKNVYNLYKLTQKARINATSTRVLLIQCAIINFIRVYELQLHEYQISGMQNVLAIFSSLINDQKILLYSQSFNRLTEACHALRSLIYPLKYGYTLVVYYCTWRPLCCFYISATLLRCLHATKCFTMVHNLTPDQTLFT